RLPAADACSGHRNAGNGPNVRPNPSHETYAVPAYHPHLPPRGLCPGQQINAAANRAADPAERATLFGSGTQKMSEPRIHARNKNWAFMGTTSRTVRALVCCAQLRPEIFSPPSPRPTGTCGQVRGSGTAGSWIRP